MGHSMGAKVAMIHALRYPGVVKGVVSIDNVPYTNPEDSLIEFEKFHLGLRTLDWCVKTHPHWSIAEMKEYLMKWVEPSEKIVTFWLTNIVTKNGRLLINLLKISCSGEWKSLEILSHCLNKKMCPRY